MVSPPPQLIIINVPSLKLTLLVGETFSELGSLTTFSSAIVSTAAERKLDIAMITTEMMIEENL